MQKYSDKFKEEMVRKMTGPDAMSIMHLAKVSGVRRQSLSLWLKSAKIDAMAKPLKSSQGKRWTPAEKLRVILAYATLDENKRGELLRHEGLYAADIEIFKKELTKDVADKEPLRVKRSLSDKKQIESLKKELRRKDKALAEASALVILSKKLNAYFDPDGVGDENWENDK